MNILIVISMIVVFFINLIFIDKIYSIVTPFPNNVEDMCKSKSNKELSEALIYGEGVFSMEICDLLIQHNISSKIINDLDKIDKSYSYKFLIAVDKSDLENIIICSICKKIMDVNIIIAVCNKQQNKKIYDKNHILYISENSFSASDIVNIVLNMQEGGDLNVYD